MDKANNESPFNLRFHQLALFIVAVGAMIGIGAALFAWFTRGQWQANLLETSLVALIAAWPVYLAYRRMRNSQSQQH